jgi:predicted nucleotidyltransferase component of viral defense system
LHHDKATLIELLEATSDSTGIDPSYIYKDYFVCMALKEIVEANPTFVFKGGTALSKCYGIIDRFSEDVDLGLDTAKPTEGQRKKTKTAVLAAMDKLGLEISNLENTRSRREFNQYKVPLPEIVTGISPDSLIVETGLMTPTEPSQGGRVISFIGELLLAEDRLDALEKYELNQFDVEVVSLERTFVDKTFAIADYYLNGDIPERQSRHVYDLYKLEEVITFDEDLSELLKRVRSQRESNHKCTSASPDIVLPDVLQEVFDKQVYRYDYETITLPLFYDNLDYDSAASAIPKIIGFLRKHLVV